MSFASYSFVFAFLPIVLLTYYSLSRIRNPYPQRIFLAAASLFFYGYFNWKYLFLLLGSITANYLLARGSLLSKAQRQRRLFFCLSLLANLGLLGYFKYCDFFLETLGHVLHTQFVLRGILLPLGISFFTFQQISFQLRIFRAQESSVRFPDYLLFVSFFPQLVAGPIVHYEELMPQFLREDTRRPNAQNLAAGLYTFLLGLSKKLLIADALSTWVDNGFAASSLQCVPAWIVMTAYAFQIYFDFSGYSDMALGLGKMFNMDLPVNFYMPYRAESVRDFWKRWHITLGRTLAELVYFPLGGNRKGKARKCLNLFLTFLASGIWHGASWTFVVWGAAHGAARVFEEIAGSVLQKIPLKLRKAGTFLLTAGAFTLFRAESFADAAKVYRGMVHFGSPGLSQVPALIRDGVIGLPAAVCLPLALAVLAACFALILFARPVPDRLRQFSPGKKVDSFSSHTPADGSPFVRTAVRQRVSL